MREVSYLPRGQYGTPEGIYAAIFPSVQRRVDWTGPVMDEIEAARRERLPADKLVDRRVWRDRRLMALLAHKRKVASNVGE